MSNKDDTQFCWTGSVLANTDYYGKRLSIDFTVTCFGSNIVMLMPYSKDKTMFDERNHLVLSLKEQASICQTYIIYIIGVVYKSIYI